MQNEFVGKLFCAPEPLSANQGPNKCLWVYDRGELRSVKLLETQQATVRLQWAVGLLMVIPRRRRAHSRVVRGWKAVV